MFKLLTFVALFAALAVAFASKAEEDQESADLFFARYGYYPAGFSGRFAYTVGNVAGYPAAYPYAPVAYQAVVVPTGYKTAGYKTAGYKTAGYIPAAAAAVVY